MIVSGLPQSMLFLPQPMRLAQILDLVRQRGILAGVVKFHVSQLAVDFPEPRLDVAGGPARGLAHTLPEFGIFRVAQIHANRFWLGDFRRDPVGYQSPGKGEGHGRDDCGEADPGNIDPGVVGNPGTDTTPLGALLVEIEFGARGAHDGHEAHAVGGRVF